MTPPLTAERLRSYSDLVRDPNPVHVDPVFARGLGLPDAIAQGGLVVTAITRMFDAAAISEVDVQLLAPVPAGTAITCEGTAGSPGADGRVVVRCVARDGGRTFATAEVVLVGSAGR